MGKVDDVVAVSPVPIRVGLAAQAMEIGTTQCERAGRTDSAHSYDVVKARGRTPGIWRERSYKVHC